MAIGLALLTFAVFAPTLSHAFIDYDDNAYVYGNPVVARGLSVEGFRWAFSGAHVSNWHPLTWLSHMLDCQLYGLHPAGHHLTNLLLHTATVILLFLVLRRATGALWRSAFVAAVFAIHPLRVESVAWVAERKDVLSGLFFVLTLAAYISYARQPRSWRRYGWVALFFALGLMSKPMLVTLPAVLLLLDYWPLQRTASLKALALEKLPLCALSAVVAIITLQAQNDAMQSIPLLPRLSNAVVTAVVYLGQMVFPAGLSVFYPYPHHGLPLGEATAAAAALAAITAIALWQRRRQPWLLVGWLWYLVMLLPVAGIIQVGNQAHADRYTYLPQIGIYLSITWMLARWAAARQWSRFVSPCAALAVVAALAVGAARQSAYWQDSKTLWSHALVCDPNNEMAHYGMGNVYLQEKACDHAFSEFQAALQIKPDYAEAWNNAGFSLARAGKTEAALPYYQHALQLQPAYGDAWLNLGNAFLQKQDWAEAVNCYQKATLISPDNTDIQGNLGIALFHLGKADEAIRHFQIARQLNPNDAQAVFNVGNALAQTGKTGEAIPYLQAALRLDPSYDQAHFALGLAFARTGQAAEAITQYKAALRSAPSDPVIQNTLAWQLATCADPSLRQGRDALQLAVKACDQTRNGNPIYLRTLAAALAETGQFAEARQTVQKAISLVRAAKRTDMEQTLHNDLERYEQTRPLHP
jgi:tetratricopeptide (TPR) repeat protein